MYSITIYCDHLFPKITRHWLLKMTTTTLFYCMRISFFAATGRRHTHIRLKIKAVGCILLSDEENKLQWEVPAKMKCLPFSRWPWVSPPSLVTPRSSHITRLKQPARHSKGWNNPWSLQLLVKMFPFVRTCSPGVSLLGIEAVVSTHLTIFFPAECNIATIEIVKKFRDEMQVDDERLQKVFEVCCH